MWEQEGRTQSADRRRGTNARLLLDEEARCQMTSSEFVKRWHLGSTAVEGVAAGSDGRGHHREGRLWISDDPGHQEISPLIPGPWPGPSARTGVGYFRWREPPRSDRGWFGLVAQAPELIRYAASHADTAIIGCGTVEEVRANFAVAQRFIPMTPQELVDLEARLEPVASSYDANGALRPMRILTQRQSKDEKRLEFASHLPNGPRWEPCTPGLHLDVSHGDERICEVDMA